MENFNDINSMLDKIKGGKTETALFSGFSDPNDIRICKEDCASLCKDFGAGNNVGTVQGTVIKG